MKKEYLTLIDTEHRYIFECDNCGARHISENPLLNYCGCCRNGERIKDVMKKKKQKK